jgi:hypothetical protein
MITKPNPIGSLVLFCLNCKHKIKVGGSTPPPEKCPKCGENRFQTISTKREVINK